MYLDHFGLNRPPFKITPDTRAFFPGGSRGEILEAMLYAITSGEGIVKVVGEVGSGKTMLSRMLEVRLPDTVDIVYLANPNVAPGDILQAIVLELGIGVEAGAGRLDVLHRLQTELLARHARGRQVVCFIEEAQAMPLATLEEIRLLSNLETQEYKLLQIVLFGQPELDENLDRPEIRQLRERIVHSFDLGPFGVEEIREYVRFRMQAAGYRGPDLFTQRAYRRIAKASQGLVRRVNVIGDKALLAAYARNGYEVTHREIRIAVADSEFGRVRRSGGGARLAWAAGIGVLAVALGAGAYLGGYRPTGPGSPGAVSAGEQAMAQPVPAEARSRAEAAAEPAPVVAAVTVAPPAPTVQPTAASPRTAAPTGTGTTRAVQEAPRRGPPAVQAAAPAVRAAAPVVRAAAPVVQAAAPAVRAAAPVVQAAAPAVQAAAPAVRAAAPVVQAAAPAVQAAAPAVRAAAPVEQAAAPRADSSPSGDTPPARVPDEQTVAAAPRRTAPAVPAAGATSEPGRPVARAGSAVEGRGSPVLGTAASGVREVPLATRTATSPHATRATVRPAAAPSQVTAIRLLEHTEAIDASADAADPDRLSQRIAATRDWLSRADDGRFSIQLMMTRRDNRRALERFLWRWTADDLGSVYVYETSIRGNSWYGVLFSEYDSLGEAKRVLDSLPEELKRHKPYVRRISRIEPYG